MSASNSIIKLLNTVDHGPKCTKIHVLVGENREFEFEWGRIEDTPSLHPTSLVDHSNSGSSFRKSWIRPWSCRSSRRRWLESGVGLAPKSRNSPAAGLTSGGGTQTGSTTFVLMDKILLWYLWIMKIHDDIAGNLCELKYSRFYKHTTSKTCNFHIWLRIFM